MSYPNLVLGGAGGGGGGGITGANGSSSGGYNSGDLPSSSGYYANPYSGGGGGGSCALAAAAVVPALGFGARWAAAAFGTGDHIGGGGSGGYSFEPDNLVPAGNSWNHSYYNYGASSGVCAFRPAPLARISMPGATVSVLSGQSLSLTAQFFTQDAVEYVEWYRNGSYYASTSASSLGNYAYASTLAFGTGYANGDVWTVQIETYLESYWGENIYSIAMSTPSSVNVLYPASITSEPGNQTAISTSNVVFSVTAGGMAPLSYQWSYDGAQVVGATNASFSLTGIRMGNAGSYTVVVSNSVGSVTSTVALLTVNRATPVISAWPGASGIVYPEALSASALNGGSASVGGTFAFTAPSATPPVGVYSASITFAPSDTTNYNSVVGAVNLAVGIGTPVVTAWPAATGITFGQSLSASTLSGGTASAGGTFAFAHFWRHAGRGNLLRLCHIHADNRGQLHYGDRHGCGGRQQGCFERDRVARRQRHNLWAETVGIDPGFRDGNARRRVRIRNAFDHSKRRALHRRGHFYPVRQRGLHRRQRNGVCDGQQGCSEHNRVAGSQRHRLWTAVGSVHFERGQRLNRRPLHV